MKKKPRKRGVTVKKLEPDLKAQCLWQDFAAVQILALEVSDKARHTKRNLILPMCWIDTDKSDAHDKQKTIEAESGGHRFPR